MHRTSSSLRRRRSRLSPLGFEFGLRSTRLRSEPIHRNLGGFLSPRRAAWGPTATLQRCSLGPLLQSLLKLARAAQDVLQSAALRFLSGIAIRANVVRQPDRRATLFDPFFRIDCRSLPSELWKRCPSAGFLPDRCHRLSGCLDGHRYIQPRRASSRSAHSFVHAQRTCHSLASFAPSTPACYPPREPQMQSRCRASEPEPNLHRPLQRKSGS